MAAKMELKPAKPILKPHYTLSEALQRLESLGADIYSEQDIIELDQQGLLRIELLVYSPLTLVHVDSETLLTRLSQEEKNEKAKILTELKKNLETFDQNDFMPIFDQALLLSLLDRCIVYSESQTYHLGGITPTILTPTELCSEKLYSDRISWIKTVNFVGGHMHPNSDGFCKVKINEAYYYNLFTLYDYGIEKIFPPITNPDTKKQLEFKGILYEGNIREAIEHKNMIIRKHELSKFEQEVLGYDHRLNLEPQLSKKTAPNIIAYNQQRQQNLPPHPNDVQAKYNELHAQNPKQSQSQLYQRLAKHFDTSVSTIKRRINTTKQNS